MRAQSSGDLLNVEVVYALPGWQDVTRLKMPSGSTALQAVQQSGVLNRHPEVDLAQSKLGIFAKLIKPETPLRDRDRVEIYRPLIADPKAARKQRAAESRSMKKGESRA
jgi:putative ubiquitin-RnfH superfamily antitoxin RatB of RatAB toxin-antitoxin module